MPASSRGSGAKRGGASTAQNGHAAHSLTKKRSQRLDQHLPLGGRMLSIEVDNVKSGSGDSTPDRELDVKTSPASSSSATFPLTPVNADGAQAAAQKRIHIGQSPSSPSNNGHAKSNQSTQYGSVLPPHQYLDSLAITFFLVNLPSIFLVLVHVLFIILAVSPYPSSSDRSASWKTILPAEAFIVLLFAVVSPSVRAYIADLAEPVIASALTGNGSRGAAICAAVLFAVGRLPNVVFGGFIQLKRFSPGAFSGGLIFTAKDFETENEALDRLGDELQAWVLALIRQLIAIHVVARWSWEGLKMYLTNRVNQSKLEDATASSTIDTTSTNKRKKSTGSVVTVTAPQMPLWTTIANNYIIATKDAELKPPEDLPAFISENESALHVLEISSCSVRLCAKGPRSKLVSTLGSLDSFEVFVNRLQWREVSISLEEADRTVDETLYNQEFVILHLDIQALVSSTATEIDVVSLVGTNSPSLVFHATICTILKEAATAAAAPILGPQTVRPNSPISTLTEKLNNATDNLNELKNSQRRIRKDHKSTVASLRSEIDALHSRLEAPDKTEERARSRNLAIGTHIKQTKDKIVKVKSDIQTAETSIADRQQHLSNTQEKWESECSTLRNSHRSQSEAKAVHDKYLQQFYAEKLAINARKERLTSREVKLKGELEVQEAAERKLHEELDERTRKRQDSRLQVIRERQGTQADEIKEIEQMESQIAETKVRTVRTNAERAGLDSSPIALPPDTSASPVTSPHPGQEFHQDVIRTGDDSPETLSGFSMINGNDSGNDTVYR
jgi:hypothetical protein